MNGINCQETKHTIILAMYLIFSFYSIYSIFHLNQNSLSKFIFVLVICISTDIGGGIFGKILNGPKLTKISPKKLTPVYLVDTF